MTGELVGKRVRVVTCGSDDEGPLLGLPRGFAER